MLGAGHATWFLHTSNRSLFVPIFMSEYKNHTCFFLVCFFFLLNLHSRNSGPSNVLLKERFVKSIIALRLLEYLYGFILRLTLTRRHRVVTESSFLPRKYPVSHFFSLIPVFSRKEGSWKSSRQRHREGRINYAEAAMASAQPDRQQTAREEGSRTRRTGTRPHLGGIRAADRHSAVCSRRSILHSRSHFHTRVRNLQPSLDVIRSAGKRRRGSRQNFVRPEKDIEKLFG